VLYRDSGLVQCMFCDPNILRHDSRGSSEGATSGVGSFASVTAGRSLPVYPDKRTISALVGMSQGCHYGNQASLGANNSSRAPPLRQRRAKRNTTALVGPPPIACRCLRQQATLVARVPDRPCWRSFRVDKNNSAHEEARCDECAPGPSLERCGDRRSTRPLCPFRRSYDTRAGRESRNAQF
jgi:hypothetical protein